MNRSTKANSLRAKCVELITALPEATATPEGNHLSLEVRGKRFGWYLDDHHDDRRIANNSKPLKGQPMKKQPMGKWQGVTQKLRTILQDCGLDETQKWGKPCFTLNEKNIAIIQPFKEHCSLMFFKGSLLVDTHGQLRSQGANTQSAMRLEFTSETQVKRVTVASYVKQAIEVEKAGLKPDFKAKDELVLPEELNQFLSKDRKLAKAFHLLTPGRKRGYVLHFTGAKQSKTRTARVEKCIPRILAGKGLNDR